MKHSKMSKVIATVLCVMMLLGAFPVSVFASIANWDTENVVFEGTSFGTNGYYNVISKKDYVLVPGAATETEMVLNNAAGTRRQVIHVIEVDPSNPDVAILPGYYNIDKDVSIPENQKAMGLTQTAAYYESELGYSIVGGMNTDLTYTNDAPRVLVYNGEILGEGLGGNGEPLSYLGVYKDAEGNISCMVKPFTRATLEAEVADGTLFHAVAVSFGMVVNNGELVNKKESRSGDASRSMVGVKADGTLVLVMNDGRGANSSLGFGDYEEGECMLALGCKWAANCDGGGSSTFISRRLGDETFVMRSKPSDGSERATLHSVLIASNVTSDGVFKYASVECEDTYVTPNSVVTFTAVGADRAGMPVAIPAEATWQLADASFGTIENGVFTSTGKTGTAVAQLVYNGDVVGSASVEVVVPTAIKFAKAVFTVPFEKTVTMKFTATTDNGIHEVKLKPADYALTLSDASLGVIDGATFTAQDGTGAVTEGTITVSLVGTDLSNASTLRVAQGSVIVEDFEDQKTNITAGSVYSVGDTCTCEIVDAEHGKVRNGDYSLAVTIDNTDYIYYTGRSGAKLFFNTVTELTNIKNASAVSFWMYVPQELEGVWFSPRFKTGSTTYKPTNYFSSCKAGTCGWTSVIEKEGWYHISIDISDVPGPTTFDQLHFYTDDFQEDANFNYNPADYKNHANRYTMYFDDFTIDYSDAVEDMENPVFEDLMVTAGTFEPVKCNGNTVLENDTSFTIKAKDYEADNTVGLDASSARAFLDGKNITDKVSCSPEGMISIETMILAEGYHSIRVEIDDANGNTGHITRGFVVNSNEKDAPVVIEPADKDAKDLLCGSVYWMNVKTTDVANFKSASFVLDLACVHNWEYEHIDVANGFSATCDYNYGENTVAITVTKTDGAPVDGEAVMLSLPIRVWSRPATGAAANPEWVAHWVKSIAIHCESGEVTYTDGTKDTFCMAPFDVDTENKYAEDRMDASEVAKIPAWHVHDAHAIDDKAAEIGVAGYTGRTYCDECHSIVDWGETIPALVHTHSYELVEGKFVCSDETCGDVYDAGTGIFEMNGKTYYAISGSLVKGWQELDGTWYYLGSDYAAVTSNYTISGRTYIFAENGALVGGQWFNENGYKRYYIGPSYYRASNGATLILREIDGNTYGFDTNGNSVNGFALGRSGYGVDTVLHFFDEDGVQQEFDAITGLVEIDGQKYYVENNIATHAGLVLIDGYYYYIKTNFTPAIGRYWVNNGNGLKSAGYYEFGEDGKMIVAEVKNGVVDGYYYVNGSIKEGAGLIQIGTDYYYVRSNGAVATGRYWVNNGNGLKSEGYYTFAENGKMIVD